MITRSQDRQRQLINFYRGRMLKAKSLQLYSTSTVRSFKYNIWRSFIHFSADKNQNHILVKSQLDFCVTFEDKKSIYFYISMIRTKRHTNSFDIISAVLLICRFDDAEHLLQ